MICYEIQHKTQHWIAATGFYDHERAEAWLKLFNPANYDDKTLRADDFKIVELVIRRKSRR